MNRKTLVSLGLGLVMTLALVNVVAAQTDPSVTVEDQAIAEGSVIVPSVTSDGAGWIVIHTDADGKPGPVIGYAAVEDGENTDVVVEIDAEAATSILHAMLHVDEGTEGTYEFPGADVPAMVGDAIVMAPFSTEEGVEVEMGDMDATDEMTETAEADATAMGTIVDIAAGSEDFSTLVAALQAAGLVEALQGEGPFTVFAPTNAAFEALPAGTVDALLADPAGDLTQILLYHVVAGQVMAADVTDGLQATTLQGGTVTFSVDGDTVMVNDATVISTDLVGSNGVIHVIDSVLLPELGGEEDDAEATATPVAEEEADATATPEAEEEAEATATPVAEEEAEATATPVAEEEATPAPQEEGDDAKGGDMSGGDMSGGESKGGMSGGDMSGGDSKGGEAPATMPATGGNFGGSPLLFVVVGAVLAGLLGSAWVSRRRTL